MFKKLKRNKYYPIIIGIMVTVVVFVIGFGVMSIMYYYWLQTSSNGYHNLKGLYDYKASLWGDAICLPIILGAGTTYILTFYGKVKHRDKFVFPITLGTLGGIGGIIMQAQWLISDSTLLNWSIPELHYFNYAGWYHAVFFVFVCTTIAFQLSCILQISINLKTNVNFNSLHETLVYSFLFGLQDCYFCSFIT